MTATQSISHGGSGDWGTCQGCGKQAYLTRYYPDFAYAGSLNGYLYCPRCLYRAQHKW